MRSLIVSGRRVKCRKGSLGSRRVPKIQTQKGKREGQSSITVKEKICSGRHDRSLG